MLWDFICRWENVQECGESPAALLKNKHRDGLELCFFLRISLACVLREAHSSSWERSFPSRRCSQHPVFSVAADVAGSPSPPDTRLSPLLSSYKHSHTLSNPWQLYCCCQELKGAITPHAIQKIKPADRNSSPKGSPVKVIKETTLQGLPQATAPDHWGLLRALISCQELGAASFPLPAPSPCRGLRQHRDAAHTGSF